MKRKLNTDFFSTYRSSMGQTVSAEGDLPAQYRKPTREREPRTQKRGSSQYDRYLYKLEMNDFNSFNSVDLVYYFQAMARKAGVRYSIANISKEAAMFKNLLKEYEPKEVVDMINFVFISEQTYLNRERLSPGVLVSQWRNTIFPDTQLWLKGEFTQNIKKSTARTEALKKREWGKASKEKSVSIGEWV